MWHSVAYCMSVYYMLILIELSTLIIFKILNENFFYIFPGYELLNGL